jgi:multidrug efflux pump subunit AcrA (membrane-fusion protein)
MAVGPVSPQVVEEVRRRRRESLTWMQSLAEDDHAPGRFYGLWAGKIVEMTGARCARVWAPHGERGWKLAAFAGIDATAPVDGDETEAVRTANLDEVRRTERPRLTAAPGGPSRPNSGPNHDASADPTVVAWYPLSASGKLRAVVELRLSAPTEASRRGCTALLAEAAGAAERYHLLADHRTAERRAAETDQERRLLLATHRRLDTAPVAFALANDGRLVVGCDRLTVLRRYGRRCRVAAVSGQAHFDDRSGSVRALEALAARAVATGRRLEYPSETPGDPKTEAILARYVEQSQVTRVVVAPLAVSDGEAPTAAAQASPGVVVAEYFGRGRPASDERRRLDVVVRAGAGALANAIEHEGLFLYPLWKGLGKLRQAFLAKGTRRRTFALLAVAAAVVTALALVPADFTAHCRGSLQPVERRRVFAPIDGIVKRVAVRHGERVKQGQVLVELQNTELEIAVADAEGRRAALLERLTAVERTLLDEGKRLSAEEQARLSGDRSEAREQIASLDRELALYAQKRRQCTVISPLDGEVTTWNAESLLENRPVRRGQVLVHVAATDGPWQLELRVPDDRSGRIVAAAAASPEPLRVTFSPATDPTAVGEGRVVEIQNSAELRGEDGNTVLVRAEIDASQSGRRPGAEAVAHIHCGRKPVGHVWSKDVADFVRSKVLFRWFP